MKYRITNEWLTIESPRTVSKKALDGFLNSAKAIHPNSDVWSLPRRLIKAKFAVDKACCRPYSEISTDMKNRCWYYIIGGLVWPFLR